MTTSPKASFSSEIEDLVSVIPVGKRAYFQARLRNRLYDLILRKFVAAEEERGLTRAALARRIERKPEVITRLLNSPGNWTLDTVSDLLLGISGEELDLDASLSSTKNRYNSNVRKMSEMVQKARDIANPKTSPASASIFLISPSDDTGSSSLGLQKMWHNAA